MKELCEILKTINDYLPESMGKIKLKNEHIEITESEVIMKIPLTLTIKISKDEFDSEDAIRQAISRAVSAERRGE